MAKKRKKSKTKAKKSKTKKAKRAAPARRRNAAKKSAARKPAAKKAKKKPRSGQRPEAEGSGTAPLRHPLPAPMPGMGRRPWAPACGGG